MYKEILYQVLVRDLKMLLEALLGKGFHRWSWGVRWSYMELIYFCFAKAISNYFNCV
jgi:hypothetical protein